MATKAKAKATTETGETASPSSDRIVTLKNGVQKNFKTRMNVIQETDEEKGVISFSVISGESFELSLDNIEGVDYASLPEIVRKLVIFGAASKIKQGLAGVPAKETTKDGETIYPLAASIEEAIKTLLEGKFVTRTSVPSEASLSETEKFFAVAAGMFEKYPFYNPDFANCVAYDRSEIGNFVFFNEHTPSETIVKIKDAWNSLDKKEKAVARKHPFFAHVAGQKMQKELAELKII